MWATDMIEFASLWRRLTDPQSRDELAITLHALDGRPRWIFLLPEPIPCDPMAETQPMKPRRVHIIGHI